MRKKPIAIALLLGVIVFMARIVEKRTRPELPDEYAD